MTAEQAQALSRELASQAICPPLRRRSWRSPDRPLPWSRRRGVVVYHGLCGPVVARKCWFIFAERLISGCLLAVKYSLISFIGGVALSKDLKAAQQHSVYAERSRLDDMMACTDVACHHQRRRTAMKNCLIKPKRKSVILYHEETKHPTHYVTNSPNKPWSFANDNFNSLLSNTLNCDFLFWDKHFLLH